VCFVTCVCSEHFELFEKKIKIKIKIAGLHLDTTIVNMFGA